MYLSRVIKVIILVLLTSQGFAQALVNGTPATTQNRNSRGQFALNLVIPVYADTTTANTNKGLDSLAAFIQIRSTGIVYHRDTTAGGHKWSLVTGAFTGTPGQIVVTDATTGSLVTQPEIIHQPVKFATAAPLPTNTYSAGVITASNNADTLVIDGFQPIVGDRVLIKNESDQTKNGLYNVTQVSTSSQPFILTRGSFSSIASNMAALAQVGVQYGIFNAGYTFYQQTQGAIVIGTTPLSYSKIKGYFDKGAFVGNGFKVVGSSIDYGYCPTCPGATELSWVDIFAGYAGITTYSNLSLPSQSVRAATLQLGWGVGTLQGAALFNNAGFNAARINLSGDTLHRYAYIKAGNRRIAAIQFTKAIQFYRNGASGTVNSNITTSQSAVSAIAVDTLKDLSSRALYYRNATPADAGTNIWYKTSTTANETITITNVQGSDLGIGVMADSSGGSRIEVYVDGVLNTTYDPNGRATNEHLETGGGASLWTFQRYGIIPDEIIIHNLQDTLHTIILKFLDGSVMGCFDHIATLKSQYNSFGAPLYMVDNFHMWLLGYAGGSGTTPAALDSASSSAFQDIQNNFPGYAAYRGNVNFPSGYYNPKISAQIQPDQVHPSGLGQRNIAQSLRDMFNSNFFNPYSLDNVLTGSGISSKKITLTGVRPDNSLLLETLGLEQIASVNGAFINENITQDGAANRYIKNGYGSQIYFGAGLKMFRMFNTGTAGSDAGGNLKTVGGLSFDGGFAFGGNMTTALGFANASIIGDNTGNVSITNIFTTHGVIKNLISKTSGYAIGVNDNLINCPSGTFTLTLPTAVGVTGKEYKMRNSGAGNITIATTSSQTINGTTPPTLTAGQTLIVYSDGANWISF